MTWFRFLLHCIPTIFFFFSNYSHWILLSTQSNSMEMSAHQNLNRQPAHHILMPSGEVEHKQFKTCCALSSLSSCRPHHVHYECQQLNFYSLNVVASKLLGWQCRLPSTTTGSIHREYFPVVTLVVSCDEPALCRGHRVERSFLAVLNVGTFRINTATKRLLE
jgi:hypothetical protein